MTKIFSKNKQIILFYLLLSAVAYISSVAAFLGTNAMSLQYATLLSLFFPAVIFSPIWSNHVWVRENVLFLRKPLLHQVPIENIQEVTMTGLGDMHLIYKKNGQKRSLQINTWLYTKDTLRELLSLLKKKNRSIKIDPSVQEAFDWEWGLGMGTVTID